MLFHWTWRENNTGLLKLIFLESSPLLNGPILLCFGFTIKTFVFLKVSLTLKSLGAAVLSMLNIIRWDVCGCGNFRRIWTIFDTNNLFIFVAISFAVTGFFQTEAYTVKQNSLAIYINSLKSKITT